MEERAERPMTPRSTRLPAWLDSEVREFSARYGEGPSEALRRIVAEWWVRRSLPALEFRETPLGRRAALRGGPEVWEVVSVGREYGDDLEGLYEHFGWLERESVDQALKYHEHFPEEIRGLIEANERLGRYLGERLA